MLSLSTFHQIGCGAAAEGKSTLALSTDIDSDVVHMWCKPRNFSLKTASELQKLWCAILGLN